MVESARALGDATGYVLRRSVPTVRGDHPGRLQPEILQFKRRGAVGVSSRFDAVSGLEPGPSEQRAEHGQSDVRRRFRQAVRAGRLSPEDARWILGNDVDVLKTELGRSGK